MNLQQKLSISLNDFLSFTLVHLFNFETRTLPKSNYIRCQILPNLIYYKTSFKYETLADIIFDGLSEIDSQVSQKQKKFNKLMNQVESMNKKRTLEKKNAIETTVNGVPKKSKKKNALDDFEENLTYPDNVNEI